MTKVAVAVAAESKSQPTGSSPELIEEKRLIYLWVRNVFGPAVELHEAHVLSNDPDRRVLSVWMVFSGHKVIGYDQIDFWQPGR